LTFSFLFLLIENAKVVDLDRWKVKVVPRRHLRIRLPTTTIFMNNYLSIGVDALVTHNFHKARESPFYLISSRIINKLIYFSYGTKDVLERQCQNLNNKLELHMDGKKIELPEIGLKIEMIKFDRRQRVFFFRVSCDPEHPLLGCWCQAMGAWLRP
jgi:hypothetical protein